MTSRSFLACRGCCLYKGLCIHSWNLLKDKIYLCMCVATIQVCIIKVTTFYVYDTTAFNQNIFWDFKALEHVWHDTIPMSWVDVKFDLNEAKSVEHMHLHFSRLGYNILAYLSHGDKTRSVVIEFTYANIICDVKILCKDKLKICITLFWL